MIPVLWLSLNPDTPPRGYWDMGILEDLFSNNLWATGYDFEHYENSLPKDCKGAVVVFPARAQVDYIKDLNELLATLDWVVLLLTGDEEAVFPKDKIKHNNIRIYVMSPREDIDSKYRFLGTGYPPQIHQELTSDVPAKDLDWFFAGQITHERRQQCAEQLRLMHNGVLIETPGFTQGLKPDLYYGHLSHAKVAPAPSGPQTPDSFRLFEALECAAVPIADTRVPKNDFSDNYWTFFFREEPPFPVLREYEQLPGYVEDTLNQYPKINNRVFSWWIKKKRELALQISKDITDISSDLLKTDSNSMVTVIIPTSPIKSHPDISILDETIKSIRHHLPTAEIILTFDGVRKEQESRRDSYEEFIRRVLWKCNTEYKNVLPLIFEEHAHQSGMAREALKYVQTPLLLYVEQDTPLVTDFEIPFDQLIDELIDGTSNMIRFHFEAVIPKDHLHMMHGNEDSAIPLIRTSQWSQRPHLASVAFYKRILSENFSDKAKSFIEDLMHGVLDEAYRVDGIHGWQQYRVHIYAPEGNFKRSYHTDGRAGAAKYDDTQVF